MSENGLIKCKTWSQGYIEVKCNIFSESRKTGISCIALLTSDDIDHIRITYGLAYETVYHVRTQMDVATLIRYHSYSFVRSLVKLD